MKAIVVALIVMVAFASNVHGQTKEQSAKMVKKISENCMKKLDVSKGEIVECFLTPTPEWPDNKECKPKAQCFFECPMGFAFVLDKNKCFDCDKGKSMIDKFMKGELKESGDCLKEGIDQCCYDKPRKECCKETYEIFQCILPICGEHLAAMADFD